METSLNEASRWRVELAGKLCSCYSSHPGVKMVCLGGSSARGTADAWSDLDVIVYWEDMDEDWIRAEPLAAAEGVQRTALISTGPGSFLESYHLQNLKADFAHVKLADWREWIRPLHTEPSPDNELISMMEGFLSSMVFHGQSVFDEMFRSASVYPDSLAIDVIQKNTGFFVNGYLEGQCLDRGDLLAWYDGMLVMIKKLLNITAALNRYYFHAGEARWAEYHLDRMKRKPAELTWANILRMLENPGPETAAMLSGIQMEILEMVVSEFPELADRIAVRKSRMESLAVRPCLSRPAL